MTPSPPKLSYPEETPENQDAEDSPQESPAFREESVAARQVPAATRSKGKDPVFPISGNEESEMERYREQSGKEKERRTNTGKTITNTEPSHATLPRTQPPVRKCPGVLSCSDTTNEETTQIQEKSNADMAVPVSKKLKGSYSTSDIEGQSTGVEEPSDVGGDLPRGSNQESVEFEKEKVDIPVEKEDSKVSEQTIDTNEIEQETVESEDTESSHAALPQIQPPDHKHLAVPSCSDRTNKETTQIQGESNGDTEPRASKRLKRSNSTSKIEGQSTDVEEPYDAGGTNEDEQETKNNAKVANVDKTIGRDVDEDKMEKGELKDVGDTK
ncbi:hypothetical protein ACFE04_006177 [Oxalis oulophora]